MLSLFLSFFFFSFISQLVSLFCFACMHFSYCVVLVAGVGVH